MKHTTDSLVETVRNIFQDSDHVSWQSDAEMITKTVLTLQLVIKKVHQPTDFYSYIVVGELRCRSRRYIGVIIKVAFLPPSLMIACHEVQKNDVM